MYFECLNKMDFCIINFLIVCEGFLLWATCGFVSSQTKLPQKPKQARRRRRQGGVEETDSGAAAANASYEGENVEAEVFG